MNNVIYHPARFSAPQAMQPGPSVGGVIKKMLAINPELSAAEMIDFIKQSLYTQAQKGIGGEFAQVEVLDERRALRLAESTLSRQN